MEEYEDLNWQEVAVKGRSKREIYRILVVKGKYYLSPESQANSTYIHDVMNGKKKVSFMDEIKLLKILKQKDVIMAHVPHVYGLRVHQILDEARKHCQIDEFMPELNDEKLPNRKFVVNIVNSLISDELQQMVDRAMEEREEKCIKKKNITMKVLPEFQSLFAETKEISSKAYFGNEIGENGRFYTMIRNADQRRTKKAERLLNQHRERDIRQEVEMRDKAIEELKQKIKDFEEISKENDKNAEILSRLYEGGIINEEGDLLEKNEQ